MPDSSDEKTSDCVFSGLHGQVKFARATSGSLMVKPEWDKQSKQWKKAFTARFVNITSNKELYLSSREHFKRVQGDLFEFKHNGQKSRIFTFRDGKVWYLVDVFVEKKEDDLPPGVVKRAVDRMEDARVALAQMRIK